MTESAPVEGLFDFLKFDQLKSLIGLRKYLPLLEHLRKWPEFWQHVKAFELDKAGDLFEAACIAVGFPDVGKVIDDIMDAVESKDVSKILDELGDALKFLAALIGGKKSDDVIRMPVVGDTHVADAKSIMNDMIDEYGLDKPATVSASNAPPVENPMVIIGIAGLVLQAIRLFAEWKKNKK